MSKTYDERDMPVVADAYDELEELYFEGSDLGIEELLQQVGDKYKLSERDRGRIVIWLEDEILTQQGDAEAQVRLDEDH